MGSTDTEPKVRTMPKSVSIDQLPKPCLALKEALALSESGLSQDGVAKKEIAVLRTKAFSAMQGKLQKDSTRP